MKTTAAIKNHSIANTIGNTYSNKIKTTKLIKTDIFRLTTVPILAKW